MQYQISGSINSDRVAVFSVKKHDILFGLQSDQEDLPNPAELLLGAFSACCLKNVQRFSELLGFTYTNVSIEVTGERQEKPTKIVAIHYAIHLSSSDKKLNPELLHKNLQKFGTIYNTLKELGDVSGEIIVSA